MDMMQMMGLGGGKMVEDEMAILTSRDILTQVVSELDLQSEYRKKRYLRWEGQYPSRDLTVEYPPVFLDTTKKFVKIKLCVRKDDYAVKVQYGKWRHSRHTVKDITQPFNTCAGEIYFTIHRPMETGKKYKIFTLPMLPAVDKYAQAIQADILNKESNVIVINTVTDMPQRAIDFMKKEIELYNLDAVIDKNLMASNTATFIEDRLRLIEEELSVAEAEVEQYKENYGIVDLTSEAGLYLRESAEYKKRVAEIETQLNLVKYVADYVSDDSKAENLIPANLGIADGSLISLIAEYNRMVLNKMRVQRTAMDNNPVVGQMDRQLAVMRENIITSIASVSNSLKISKQDLEKRYGNVESQRGDIPSQERKYREVARNKQLKESLYLYLYEKREENALTLASTIMPAKVIAQPQMNPTASAPRLKIIGLICLILGCGFPFAVIYLYYIFNNRLEDDTKELERKTKMPFGPKYVFPKPIISCMYSQQQTIDFSYH